MNSVSSVEDEFAGHAGETEGFEYLKLDESLISEAVAELENSGLDKFIESSLDKLKLKRIKEGGLSLGMIKSYFNGYDKVGEVIEFMDRGPVVHQRMDWKPNGLAGFNACNASSSNFVIQNHSLAKLQKKGHLLIIPYESVKQEDIDSLHFSGHSIADKYDINGVRLPECRVCMNGSFGKAGESRNSGLDRKKSEEDYPPEVLVDVGDLCERACQLREKYPNEEIHGTLVDYAKAYNLANQSIETAKLCASTTKATIGGVEMSFILIYLVAIFGCADAGNWFAVLARMVTFLHNLMFHSFRYVDDNIIIDIASRVKASETNLVKHIVNLLGDKAVNEEKRIQYQQDLVAIGWKFNFRHEIWKVMPKPKSYRKMLHALFCITRVGEIKLTSKSLERVAGIMNWYMKALPLGQSFVRSLYSCIDWSGHNRKVTLSLEAQMDIQWLRAIVVIAQVDPEILSADIDSIRESKIAKYAIYGDASTSVGGGSFLCKAMDISKSPLATSRVRWSTLELQMFESMRVSINVLEFFQQAYSVLLWGNILSGNVVQLFCDNTAAVVWIENSRGNVHAVGLMPLVRLLTIYCFIKKIRLVSTHIAGVDNIFADRLSRELFIIVKEEAVNTETDNWWRNLPREEVCRELLKTAIVKPNSLHLSQLLGLLRHLLSTAG